MSWSIFNRKGRVDQGAAGAVPRKAAEKTAPATPVPSAAAPTRLAGATADGTPGKAPGTTPDSLTEIVFVIDESGSMHGLEDDTIGGINALLERNREVGGRAYFSTVLFNTQTRVLHDRVDIAEVPPLRERDYRPNGCTALLDAVGGAIGHIDRVQRYMPAGHKADHVLFAIATDGLENASHKYSYRQVKQLIEKHREQGWEFVFLGANIDVAQAADDLGIDRERAMPYHADSAGTAAVYDSLAEASLNVRACGSAGKGWGASVARDNARRGK